MLQMAEANSDAKLTAFWRADSGRGTDHPRAILTRLTFLVSRRRRQRCVGARCPRNFALSLSIRSLIFYLIYRFFKCGELLAAGPFVVETSSKLNLELMRQAQSRVAWLMRLHHRRPGDPAVRSSSCPSVSPGAFQCTLT